MNINKHLSTHSGDLERWLGKETVEHLSRAQRDFYWPIAVGGVPGAVYAMPGGDFRGKIRAGKFCNGIDYAVSGLIKRLKRAARLNRFQFSAGFASLSDLISEASVGKQYDFMFQKAGTTGVVGATNSLWLLGAQPPAASAAAAAPGGAAPVDSDTGAFKYTNPTSGDTLHIISANIAASLANTLLLYDRIFNVSKTMNSTATESVTGVPTRYQNQTGGTMDYIGGNFLAIQTGLTALAATAHNWTVCTYNDQGGASSTLPSVTGNSGGIVHRLDHPVMSWFCPLETGDVGVKALTQMQCSALVATGTVEFFIGHPIAWMPIPIINQTCTMDYINTALNLTRIFDDAALAFLEVNKPATGATNYNGMFSACAG